MENFAGIMFSAHTGFRMLVLLGLIVGIVKYAIGYFGKGSWTSVDSTINRVLPILVDIQWLLGLILFIVARTWTHPDPARSMWHPLIMTVGVIVTHFFARRAATATTDNERFSMAFIGYLLSFVLIALGVYLLIGINIFGM